jgi:hypothetical protein
MSTNIVKKEDIQLFLTLLDTIHDFGNTSRVSAVITPDKSKNKKTSTEFNPAFIIDFLMLGYIHNRFQKLIGLDNNQNYIRSIENCSKNKFVKNSNIAKHICKQFYYPTYSDSIMFRSPNPEEISKDILFDYLKGIKIIYDESNVLYWNSTDIDWTKKGNCVRLKLGNIGNKEVDEKDPSGIFDEEDEKTQSKKLYNKIKDFYGNDVAYATDANKLNKNWFCVDGIDETHYTGIFAEYDSFKRGKKGGTNNTNNNNSNNNDLPIPRVETKCELYEFQPYSLDKTNNELIRLEQIFVRKRSGTDLYIVNHKTQFKYGITEYIKSYAIKTGNETKTIINNSKVKERRGLSLFILLFNEINKKTLGYKEINRGTVNRSGLEQGIKSLGLEALKDTYKISLTILEAAENVRTSKEYKKEYACLDPVDFILALFDFKRSMDYLYVKACQSANIIEETKLETNINYKRKKYVFVSADRSAIYYSLMLNNPCILTPPIPTAKGENKGEQEIIMYNPPPIEQPKIKQNSSQVKQSSSQVKQSSPQIIPNNSTEPSPEDAVARALFEELLPIAKKTNNINANNANNANNVREIELIEEIKEISVLTFDEQLSNLTNEVCIEFIQLYDDDKTEKIYNPITRRTVAKLNKNIKLIYNYCKGIQKAEEELKTAKEKKKINAKKVIDDLREIEETETKRLEKERKDKINDGAKSIIKDGISKKTILDNKPKQNFGSKQISDGLIKYNITAKEFCKYLDDFRENIDVIEFKRLVVKTHINTICSKPKSGGSLQEQLENIYNSVNSSSSNTNNTLSTILLQNIPLVNLETMCEVGSPMYIFFQFYGQLTPSISFFWFITFKSLLFFTFGNDMDREDCEKFAELNTVNSQITNNSQLRQQNNSQIRQQNNSQLRQQTVQPNVQQNSRGIQQTVQQNSRGVQQTVQQNSRGVQQNNRNVPIKQAQQYRQVQQAKPKNNIQQNNNNTTRQSDQNGGKKKINKK